MTAIAEYVILTTMPPKTAGKGKKIAAASSAAEDAAPKKGRGRPKGVPGKRAKKRKESYAIYIYKVGRLVV